MTEAIQEIDFSEMASKGDMGCLEQRIDRLETLMRELELRMTLKLGTLIGAGIAVLAAMKYFAG